MDDPSQKPENNVDDLILDVQHSFLSGYEPFYVTVRVKVNMKKYRDPKTTLDPSTTRDAIKLFGGSTVMHTVSYNSRIEDYEFEIYVRDFYSKWQVKTLTIHVDENPSESLIKHFSIKTPMVLLNVENQAMIPFDLLCDPKVIHVKWFFDDKKPDEFEIGRGREARQHIYREIGIFDGRINVYQRNPGGKPPEKREFQVIILDSKNT